MEEDEEELTPTSSFRRCLLLLFVLASLLLLLLFGVPATTAGVDQVTDEKSSTNDDHHHHLRERRSETTTKITKKLHLDCEMDNELFMCDPGQCIDLMQRCNGIAECANGADESVWECGCLPEEFFCNGTCIDALQRCDTKPDCPDYSDEQNCETFSCLHSYFKCDNHFCIPGDHLCNFVDDCGDNSDEHNCQHRACWFGEFRCRNGQCIRAAFLCDNVDDCIDASDEQSCDPHNNYVECADGTMVHQAFWCDDWPECKDNHADELNCRQCNWDEFRCANSRCIRAAHVCDGVCDCASQCEDERNCHRNYKTVNGVIQCLTGESIFCQGSERCVAEEFICDGKNDCRNGNPSADEYGCGTVVNETADVLPCPDGRSVPAILRCDHHRDCLDGFDELDCHLSECNTSVHFACGSGECVDQSLRCDTFFDCKDRSDEIHCELQVCPSNFFRCATGHCIPETWECDYRPDCPDSSDETACPEKGRNCSMDTEFRCRNGQCVPADERCHHRPNLRSGCADGSHLLHCRAWTCADGQFKCRNSYCIDSRYVCNGEIDCKSSWSDESDCPFKCSDESSCHCRDVTIDCSHAFLRHLPRNVEKEISRFVLPGNYLNETLGPDTFRDLERISFLDLSRNWLQQIPPLSFHHLYRLRILQLHDNRLVVIHNATFYGLGSVATLNLERNDIVHLETNAFYGLSSLKHLDLSHQKIVTISHNAFLGLRHLRKLNLSHNRMQYLVDGCFNGIPRLLSLDLSHNVIQIMGSNVFHSFNTLQHLETDEFRFCCLARVTFCLPKPNEFSSCEDLMSNLVLRVCIWILGVVAFIGNMLVIVWRTLRRTNNKVHSFLITNLAVGDMFMGIYLLVIAVVDARYRGVYFIYDLIWRQSSLCQLVGFVSTFSSELSVFTITVITLDRFVSIIFPFRIKRLEMKHTRVVMIVIWIGVVTLAGVPLLNIDYFDNFYGRSGVCLALHITHDKPSGWEYSVFVFLALNFVSFAVVAASYVWMYAVARRTHKAVHAPEVKRDNNMARRMTLIVFTDFCCWMPIIVLGVLSLSGTMLPPQVFAWIAVFVLPLNAAINPVLYTLSTAPFLGPARKRVSTFRRSFMTSISGDSHRTVLTTFGSTAEECYPCQQPSPSPNNTLSAINKNTGEIIPLQELESKNYTTSRRHSSRNRVDKVKFDKTNSLYN